MLHNLLTETREVAENSSIHRKGIIALLQRGMRYQTRWVEQYYIYSATTRGDYHTNGGHAM